MTYKVKEIFYTLQGEGTHAGRPAVFCRFTCCNLWTGRESDRGRAICQFCDTDFVGTDGPGGGKFATADDLADAVAAAVAQRPRTTTAWSSAPAANRCCSWTRPRSTPCTPAASTSRSRPTAPKPAPPGSTGSASAPRSGADWSSTAGDELKFVYPQAGGDPAQFEHLDFDTFRLQPMDGPDRRREHRSRRRVLPEAPATGN